MGDGEFDQMAMVYRLPTARVVDRLDFLRDIVGAQRVIHIGFADAGCREMQAGVGTWLHEHLAARAASVIGLDVDEPGVAAAQRAGFEAHVVDCSDPVAVAALSLEPADLVVAGEVLEHLDSPGPFLDSAASLVRREGLLVLTTPNASGLGNALAALAGYELQHPEHVTLYSCRTLTTLLAHHGWSIVEICTYVPRLKPLAERPSGRVRVLRGGGAALLGLERALGRLGRPFAADGLIVVARLVEGWGRARVVSDRTADLLTQQGALLSESPGPVLETR